MADQQAMLTINRITHRDKETISLTIEDVNSGIIVTRINMAPEDFARAITGVGNSKAIFELCPKPEQAKLFGKYSNSKVVFIRKTWSDYRPDPEVIAQAVADQGHLVDGWELWQNGLSSQQNQDGLHKVVLLKYTDEEPTDG